MVIKKCCTTRTSILFFFSMNEDKQKATSMIIQETFHILTILLVCVAAWAVASRLFEPTMPFPRELNCTPHDKNTPVVVPLVRDANNIFLLDLNVNGAWIKCAVDTGSRELVVSGHDCERCNLSHGSIAIPEGKPDTMAYVSQVDTVVWTKRPIQFLAWELGNHTPDVPVCIGGNVDTAVVAKRTGTSNYNVLGIGPDDDGFMADLMPEMPRAYSIFIESYDRAKLVLYRPTASLDSGLRLNKYKLLGRGVLMLKSIQGKPANNVRLTFDTGANAMSLPREVYRQLGYAGKLVLEMPDGVVYEFPYNKMNTWNAQVHPYDGNTIIVGVTNMVGYGIGVEQTANDGQYLTIQRA